MRVLFRGYYEAGYRALRKLVERGHEVFVTTHDSSPEIPSVRGFAESLSLRGVTQDVRGEVLREAWDCGPGILFCVYYRSILSREVLSLARQGAFNFHFRLLSRHRGCFPAGVAGRKR